MVFKSFAFSWYKPKGTPSIGIDAGDLSRVSAGETEWVMRKPSWRRGRTPAVSGCRSHLPITRAGRVGNARRPPLQLSQDQELSQQDRLLDARRGRQAVIGLLHDSPRSPPHSGGATVKSEQFLLFTLQIPSRKLPPSCSLAVRALRPTRIPPSCSLAPRDGRVPCIDRASSCVGGTIS